SLNITAIGYVDTSVDASGATVCGNMLHVDEEEDPFWWNGGIMRMKSEKAEREDWFMKFEHAAIDYDVKAARERWIWETNTRPNCISRLDIRREVMELSDEAKEIGKAYIDIYKDMKKIGVDKYLDAL
ncbi:UNVERIFIED_CONTAM: hypothetical protein HDU68_006078, partial [Siphonaria sp. JEL0065]